MNRNDSGTAARSSNQLRRSCLGFTLVELLVVIGIIGVLVSILMPTLSRARRAAINTQCLSNLRDMGHSLQMYANEYKDKVPIGQSSIVRDSHYFSVAPGGASVQPVYVCAGPVLVAGHVTNPESWYCPSPNIVDVDNRWQFNSDRNKWPPAVGNTGVRMGYYLRPGFAFGGGTAYGVPPAMWHRAPSTAKIWPNIWPQLNKFKSKAIACDLWPIPTGSLAKESPHGKTMNVLYGDRSAQVVHIEGPLKTKIELLNEDAGNTVQHDWAQFLQESDDVNLKGLWILFDRERQ